MTHKLKLYLGTGQLGRIGDPLKKKKKGAGLYANIHAKRKRIAAGSGEKMRKKGAKGAPTAAQFREAAKTAKKPKKKKK